jgi:predicted CoA-binding protein
MAKELTTEQELATVARGMRVVAVVGMRDERKGDLPGHTVPRRLQGLGVRVVPVNPNITAALGEKAWPDLASVPDAFDVVDVFRRVEAIASVADQVLALPPERRPAVVWLQSGLRDDASTRRLIAGGVDVVQDACLGVLSGRYRGRR